MHFVLHSTESANLKLSEVIYPAFGRAESMTSIGFTK
jgi:hypothetical protein